MRLCETDSKQRDLVKYKQLLYVDLLNPNGKVSLKINGGAENRKKKKQQLSHILEEKLLGLFHFGDDATA